MESVSRRLSARRMAMAERVHIPLGSLGVPRDDMPQIRSDLVPEFLRWLTAQRVPHRRTRVQVDKIKATQREIDIDKVASMVASAPEKSLAKPVIISKDFYLLDGHHRWLALVNKDPAYKIEAVQVGIPIWKLLAYAREFPQASYKQMGEAEEQSVYKKRMHKALKGWKKLFPVKKEGHSTVGTLYFDTPEEALKWKEDAAAFIERIKPIGATERAPQLVKKWEMLKDDFEKWVGWEDPRRNLYSFEKAARDIAWTFWDYRKELLDVFMYQVEPIAGPLGQSELKGKREMTDVKRIGPFHLGMAASGPWGKPLEPDEEMIANYKRLSDRLPTIVAKLKRNGLLQYMKGVRFRVEEAKGEAGATYDAVNRMVHIKNRADDHAVYHELAHHLEHLLRKGQLHGGARPWRDWRFWFEGTDAKFTKKDYEAVGIHPGENRHIEGRLKRAQVPQYVKMFVKAVHYGYYAARSPGAGWRYTDYIPAKHMGEALQGLIGRPINTGIPSAYGHVNAGEAFSETMAYFMLGKLKKGTGLWMLKQIFPTLKESDEKDSKEKERIVEAAERRVKHRREAERS